LDNRGSVLDCASLSAFAARRRLALRQSAMRASVALLFFFILHSSFFIRSLPPCAPGLRLREFSGGRE
jgi:hypothetical protein